MLAKDFKISCKINVIHISSNKIRVSPRSHHFTYRDVCVSYSNALAIILPITTLNEFIRDSSYRTTYRNVLAFLEI